MKKITYSLLIMLVVAFGAKAQTCNFLTWDMADGLISNRVNDVASDSKGNVWLATDGGLSMFDGTSFTNYTKALDTIPDDDISSVAVDAMDNVWFGTEWGSYGVVRFDGANFEVFDTTHGLGEMSVGDIHVDQFGRVWIGHFGSGVSVYQGDSFKVYSSSNGDLCDDFVTSIDSRYGKVYVNGYNGCINVLDGTTWDTIGRPLGIAELSALAVDAYENVWGITYNYTVHEVYKWNKMDSTWSNETANVPNTSYIEGVFADRLGSVWVSSDTGVSRFDTISGWTHYISDLADKFPTDITMDVNHNIWIGDRSTSNGFTKLEQTGKLTGDLIGFGGTGNLSYFKLYRFEEDGSLTYVDSTNVPGSGVQSFDFGDLPVGIYTLASWESEMPSANNNTMTYYMGQNSWEEAQPFSIATCTGPTNLIWESNFISWPQTGTSQISGRVYEKGGNPDDNPVSNVLVAIQDSASGQVWDDIWTDTDGEYRRYSVGSGVLNVYVEQFGVMKKSMHTIHTQSGNVMYSYRDFELSATEVEAVDNTPVQVESFTSQSFNIWPNPAQDFCYISSRGAETVEIFDLSGKLIHSTIVRSDLTKIDLSEWSTGIYFVSLKGAQLSKSGKFMLD